MVALIEVVAARVKNFGTPELWEPTSLFGAATQPLISNTGAKLSFAFPLLKPRKSHKVKRHYGLKIGASLELKSVAERGACMW